MYYYTSHPDSQYIVLFEVGYTKYSRMCGSFKVYSHTIASMLFEYQLRLD